MDDRLDVPQGRFVLHRTPAGAAGSLRAWDGADAYVLERLDERLAAGEVDAGKLQRGPVVVINDGFGALGVALGGFRPVSVLDSATSRRALELNLERNELADDVVTPVSNSDLGTDCLASATAASLVVMKIPRSRDRLEEQLRNLRPWLGADTVVVGAGLTRHVHTATVRAFEELVGPTVTTRARRKARLLEARVDPEIHPDATEWPKRWDTQVGSHEIRVVNHVGVFSSGRLDRGTRLLLDNLPRPTTTSPTVVDLGCGNGVLGTAVAAATPEAHVVFIDDSALAVESARETHRATLDGDGNATFVHGFRLADEVAPSSADLVLCNPPFHADNAVSTEVARQMFRDAHRCLRAEGELLVVGNRHLGHHRVLTKLFGAHRVVASDPKFVVLSAHR